MWELTERISWRNLPVLSKVEPEPGAGPLHRLRLRPKSTGSDRLRNTGHNNDAQYRSGTDRYRTKQEQLMCPSFPKFFVEAGDQLHLGLEILLFELVL